MLKLINNSILVAMDESLEHVIKSSGERVIYDRDKLRLSLENSGAGEEDVQKILAVIDSELYDGIRTNEIYKKAFQILKSTKSKCAAARYKLKRAIQELGPTGYPFEKFVAELLKYQGYKTQVGVIVDGYCVKHEIDVIAEREDRRYIVECKFHIDSNRKNSVQTPLYVKARFDDVKKAFEKDHKERNKFHQGWIVTNTKFSEDAITYGICAGMKLIGWDFPSNGSLKKRIDMSGLHPITCLTSLSKSDKNTILEEGVVLCRELLENNGLLNKLNFGHAKKRRVISEIEEVICS